MVLNAPPGYANVSGFSPCCRRFWRSLQISEICWDVVMEVRLVLSTVLPPMSLPAAASADSCVQVMYFVEEVVATLPLLA